MKRFVSFLVVLMLLVSGVANAYAADSHVKYEGNSKKFIFSEGNQYSPTDLFTNFKDVMPGDKITQKITVKNAASNGVKVKIYLRSLGAKSASVDFLSQLELTVKKSAENEMGYMFDATADKSAQLTEWVCLGTLYSGGEVNLDVELNVPTSLDNNYKNTIGYLDWEFRVEEFPVEPSDPTPPQTGNNDVIIWSAVAVFASIMIVLLLVFRRRMQDEEQ